MEKIDSLIVKVSNQEKGFELKKGVKYTENFGEIRIKAYGLYDIDMNSNNES